MSGTWKGGRPPGLPKTGGRTKGTPNRSTLALQEKLAAWGCDPEEELVKLARDFKTERGLKVSIYSLLLRYTRPLPKGGGDANEVTVNESPTTLEDAIKLARYVLERFGGKLQPQTETLKEDDEPPSKNPSSDEE